MAELLGPNQENIMRVRDHESTRLYHNGEVVDLKTSVIVNPDGSLSVVDHENGDAVLATWNKPVLGVEKSFAGTPVVTIPDITETVVYIYTTPTSGEGLWQAEFGTQPVDFDDDVLDFDNSATTTIWMAGQRTLSGMTREDRPFHRHTMTKQCAAGDTIDLRLQQFSGAPLDFFAPASISIKRIAENV